MYSRAQAQSPQRLPRQAVGIVAVLVTEGCETRYWRPFVEGVFFEPGRAILTIRCALAIALNSHDYLRPVMASDWTMEKQRLHPSQTSVPPTPVPPPPPRRRRSPPRRSCTR